MSLTPKGNAFAASSAVPFILVVFIAAAWLLPLSSIWIDDRASAEAASAASLRSATWNSLGIVLASTFLACAMGALIAHSIDGVRCRWRRPVLLIMSAPLFVPAYLIAIAWAPLLSPSGVVIQPGAGAFGLSAHSFFATVWVQGCAWFPLPMWFFHAAMRLWSDRYDEAARSCGLSAMRSRLLRLRWLIWPAVASLAVVSLMVGGEFVVADYFGVRTLGTEIFTIVSAYLDPASALAAARPLFWFSLACMIPLVLVARRARVIYPHVLPGGGQAESTASVVVLIVAAAVILVTPSIAVLGTLLGGSASPSRLLWQAWMLAAEDVVTGAAFACTTATLCGAIALVIAFASMREAILPRLVAALALATPATLWSIGASAMLAKHQASTGWLLAALIAGMTLHALSPAVELMATALRQVPMAHIEAARVSGLGPGATWFRVLLPRVSVAVVAAAGIAWIWSMNQVTLTVLLAPPGTSTLMLRIFQTVHYGPPDLLAAFVILHLGVIAAFMALLAASMVTLRRLAR